MLDYLKKGVIRPDFYEPELNAVYAARLSHYGVVAEACRVGDPNLKGPVENAIRHTQNTIEILDDIGEVLRRHEKVATGQMVLPDADRLFNPTTTRGSAAALSPVDLDALLTPLGRTGPSAEGRHQILRAGQSLSAKT